MKIPSKFTENEILLGLLLIPEIGSETIRKVISQNKLIINKSIFSDKQISNLENFDWRDLDNLVNYISKHNINYATALNDDYPSSLTNISDYPPIIFYLGNFDIINEPCISIVGTRKISAYGKQCIEKLIPDFVETKWTVVSGMAFGVDAYVHNTTINNKGLTVAVLGSGVDIPSPVTNSNLYKRILENDGLIISEQLPGTQPIPAYFPMRNRIISGLSKGTIIIEADEKSGSLITARCAFDQNREVFAIPGDITQFRSRGTNKIIKEGIAKLITSTNDVLTEFGYLENDKAASREISFDSELEKLVYNCIIENPLTLDAISIKMKIEVSELSQILTMMELKGMVTPVNSKYYVNL
jgi:DNA processing protein